MQLMRGPSNDNYRASFGPANSFKLRSIELARRQQGVKGKDVGQICVLTDAEGGPVSILPDS
jgi:hypothetical protein